MTRAKYGEPLRWLTAHQSYDDPECLIWPFATDPQGYGRVRWKRENTPAHAVMCEMVNGARPENHESCHTCGNGNKGCVNPKHLYWGTRSENIRDRKIHGTFKPPPRLTGDKNHKTKLDWEKVFEIKFRLSCGEPERKIAERFGVCKGSISDIRHGRSWASQRDV